METPDAKHDSMAAITDKYVSADGGDTVFGERWGSQLITLRADHIAALREGKLIALDVQSEYVVYLKFA